MRPRVFVGVLGIAMLLVPICVSYGDVPVVEPMAPAATTDSPPADADPLAPIAGKRCAEIGLPSDSDEMRDCVRGLIRIARSDPLELHPEGIVFAHVVGDLKIGDACEPYYPAQSRQAREQGAVLFMMYVGPDSRVKMMLIRKSSGYPRLDNAAASCITREGRFQPVMIDGKPVGSWQRIKWTWRLS